MASRFGEVPSVEIQRSTFDRSHNYKTAMDSGYLVPFLVDEALPGDTFTVRETIFARLATQLRPVMDDIYLDVFYFAVPYRLVWDHWPNFMGERSTPGDETVYEVPQMTSQAYGVGSLYDYMGLPINVPGYKHSVLPLRAYNLIWNTWCRDQNLQDPIPVPTGDSGDDHSYYLLRRRAKRHDYFTSCLPWPQKGDPVSLPLGDEAPVTGTICGPNQANWILVTRPGSITQFDNMIYTDQPQNYANVKNDNPGGDTGNIRFVIPQEGMVFHTNAGGSSLVADLSSATAATINDLRLAFQVQKMLERDARGGTRYVELIRSHFGVVSPDYRMQRPEYLGGGRTWVNVHVVPQTATGTGTEEKATLGAYATAVGQTGGFTQSFTEHCMIIGLMHVGAQLSYQQGLERQWSRRTRYDYYWPSLANIGEQPVLSKEIYCDGTSADDEVFGYQERYAEYRYKPSLITGILRSQNAQSLDVWHLAQEFSSRPTLSAEFIEDDPPLDRISAVQSEPQVIVDARISMICARPMPVYGVPGLIDHF